MSGWAAAAQVAGSLIDTGLQMYSAREAWKKQKEAIQNAHQWEVADLRKAGLNPILSATGGGSPGVNMPMPQTSVGKGVSSALQALTIENTLDQQEANIDKTKAETAAVEANARQAAANADFLRQQVEKLQRENKFMRDNPNVYGVGQANMAFPYVGGIAAALNQIVNGIGHSAKAIAQKFTGHKYDPEALENAKKAADDIMRIQINGVGGASP